MRYDQLWELVQLAGQGDTVNAPRASLLARVFLHSSLWHEAILAWDTEAQEQFDKSIVSGKHSHVLNYLTNIIRHHRTKFQRQSSMQDMR